MSEKNVYQTLRKLADDNAMLRLAESTLSVDGELLESIMEWIIHNVDVYSFLTEIYSYAPSSLKFDMDRSPYNFVYARLSNILRDEVGRDVINKSGKYNVRLKKILKQKYKVKSLTENDYCKLSTLFGDWLETSKLHFCFADKFDWQDGEFGDGGSCFWGDRASGRDTLEYYHALAIKFYKTDKDRDTRGVGRAWIARIRERDNVDGAVVMFNRYGVPRSIEDIVLALKCVDKDFVFKHVYLTNEGTSHGDLYINGDAVAVSYEELYMERVELGYSIRKGVYTEQCNGFTCTYCGDRVDEDHTCFIGDEALCETCADKHTIFCEECNETRWRDGSVELVGCNGRVCSDCLDRYDYTQCAVCCDYERLDAMRVSTNRDQLCSNCAKKLYTCDICNLLIDDNNDTEHRVESEDGRQVYTLCDSCVDECTFTCEKCDKTFYDDRGINKEDICQECREEIEYESS